MHVGGWVVAGCKMSIDIALAMEALRDRERWRSKGEERLRTAGIDEAVIDKWKNNTEPCDRTTRGLLAYGV
jgi:hypothetical protein